MRKDYARFVELSNKGAAALDCTDMGAMWRGKYEMPADAFARELDRLWEQLRPSVPVAARVRAEPSARQVGAIVPGRRADPGAPARQPVAAGLVQRRRLVAPAGEKASRFPHRQSQGKKSSRSRWCASASDSRLLGLTLCRRHSGSGRSSETARPRTGLSRERVGHRQRRRPAHQDVHRRQRGRFQTIHHKCMWWLLGSVTSMLERPHDVSSLYMVVAGFQAARSVSPS